ncbi:unnamed protein product [Effrenium voratum]|uniref:Peptidase C14 caspase domain-containing protein n=1 Tax=Effrenium voratum TaxID=2562239 RepID=A0AA36MXE5_9DINO|nr:unnamed protein product [Effrenium voratum]
MLQLGAGEWRVLIICCDAYQEAPLEYCYRCAELVREEVRRFLPHTKPIQFVHNPDSEALKDACNEFVRRPTANQRLFLYFAGHGFEMESRHFMVPVSKGPSLCLQDLRLKLEKGCILFAAWDACRLHEPFYPEEPLAFETEKLLAFLKPMKTDYVCLFSCLSGELRFDNMEFAEALCRCFSEQDLKLTDVTGMVKAAMAKHRVDSHTSLTSHPQLPPTLLGRASAHSEAFRHLSFQDRVLCQVYWTPCLYLGTTILDLIVRFAAAQGCIHIRFSTRVTFLLSMTSFFWAAFSHSEIPEIQQTPACSVRIVNQLVRNWEKIEFIAFRLRTPISTLFQVFSELHFNLDAVGACVTLSLGAIWFVLSGYFLQVIKRWRDEASPLSQARASRLWMWVFSYATWVAGSNFRILWDNSEAGRWIEFYWQTYLLLLLFSLAFTLICRCDPGCSFKTPCVAAYSLVPASSILAVILVVLWQGVAFQLVWLAGVFFQYLALFGLGLVVYVWQNSPFSGSGVRVVLTTP